MGESDGDDDESKNSFNVYMSAPNGLCMQINSLPNGNYTPSAPVGGGSIGGEGGGGGGGETSLLQLLAASTLAVVLSPTWSSSRAARSITGSSCSGTSRSITFPSATPSRSRTRRRS